MAKQEKVIEAEIVEEATDHQKRFDMVETEEKSIQSATTPMTLIEKAMALGNNIDIDKMAQLFELNLRYEENEAKKAFNAAFTAFKSEAIEVIKTKHVSFDTSRGTTSYNHAELGNVVTLVAPKLAAHGLTHHWEYGTTEKGEIEVTCLLTHELGHSRKTSLSAGSDDSGGKNKIQAKASTTSYLERYTFLAITGLASKEKPDDDGRGSEEEPVEVITDHQYAELDALLDEVKANRDGFCVHYGIKSIEMLPAEKYNEACQKLEKKRKEVK